MEVGDAPNLILLDVMMPNGAEGPVLFGQLRAERSSPVPEPPP